jgi:hypothetical protein
LLPNTTDKHSVIIGFFWRTAAWADNCPVVPSSGAQGLRLPPNAVGVVDVVDVVVVVVVVVDC